MGLFGLEWMDGARCCVASLELLRAGTLPPSAHDAGVYSRIALLAGRCCTICVALHLQEFRWEFGRAHLTAAARNLQPSTGAGVSKHATYSCTIQPPIIRQLLERRSVPLKVCVYLVYLGPGQEPCWGAWPGSHLPRTLSRPTRSSSQPLVRQSAARHPSHQGTLRLQQPQHNCNSELGSAAPWCQSGRTLLCRGAVCAMRRCARRLGGVCGHPQPCVGLATSWEADFGLGGNSEKLLACKS